MIGLSSVELCWSALGELRIVPGMLPEWPGECKALELQV
jgi:hypothetical protein